VSHAQLLEISRFLVASGHVRDLFLCAKDLFIAAIVPGPTFLRAASPHARRTPVGLLRFLGRFAPVRDLLLRAKHLFTTAKRVVLEGPSLHYDRRTQQGRDQARIAGSVNARSCALSAPSATRTRR
jgi:hypothetical protein